MITQKEIAERLGISRTTVARAINGSGAIKEETKQKILKLVEETNYEKNYIGSSLGKKKQKKIFAFVVESTNKYYTSEIKKGLNEAIKEYRAYNYNIEIITTGISEPEEQILKLKEVLKQEDIDGIIITPLDKEKVYEMLESHLEKIEVITLGIALDRGIHHVGPNHVKQGRIVGDMISNLLRDGEKILILDNGDDKVSSRMYLQGVMEKLVETKLSLVGPITVKGGISESIEVIKKHCKTEDIRGIYINRYAHDILDVLPPEILRDKKIVLNGIGKIIKRLLKKKIITATVMENISSEGYTAGKRMFEVLYKNKQMNKLWDVSTSRIIFNENLDD